MSLIEPDIIEKLKPYRIWIIGVALLVLIGVAAWIVAGLSDWSFRRSTDKKKAEIANTAKEIANISNTIANLELQKAEKQGELTRDVEQLQKDLYGLDDAKKETNQALGLSSRGEKGRLFFSSRAHS